MDKGASKTLYRSQFGNQIVRRFDPSPFAETVKRAIPITVPRREGESKMDIKKVFCYCFRRGRFFNKLLPILLQLLVVGIVWQIFQARQNGGALSLADRAEGENVPLCTPGDYTKGKTLYLKAIMNEVNVIGANAAEDKPQPHFLSAELLVRDLEQGSLILYPAGTPVIFGSAEDEGNTEEDYRDDDTELSEIRKEEERKKNETGSGDIEVSSGSRKDNLTVDLFKVDANASKEILEKNEKESNMMAISANILSGGSGVVEMTQGEKPADGEDKAKEGSQVGQPSTSTTGSAGDDQAKTAGDQMDITKLLASLTQAKEQGGAIPPDQIQQLLQLHLMQQQKQAQSGQNPSGAAPSAGSPTQGSATTGGQGTAGTPGSGSAAGTSVSGSAPGTPGSGPTSGTGTSGDQGSANPTEAASSLNQPGASGTGTSPVGASQSSLSGGTQGTTTSSPAGSPTPAPGTSPTGSTGSPTQGAAGTPGAVPSSTGQAAGVPPSTGSVPGQPAASPSSANAVATTSPASSPQGDGGTPNLTPQDTSDASGPLFAEGFEERVKTFQIDFYGKHLGNECVNTTIPNYVMNNPQYCDQFPKVDIFYVIGMSPQNEERRSRIRETFAKPNLVNNYNVAHIFITGKTATASYQAALDKERGQFGDIVQGDFMDGTDTMTQKTLLGLKWARQFCRKAKYVMKIDEDMFVDSEKLLLGFLPAVDKVVGPRTMLCALVPQGPMPRTGSRAFPRNLYPNTPMLKPFCKGFAVLLTQDAISSILATALHTPYVTVEDIYVFGILPTLAGNIELYDVGQKRAFHDYGKEVVACYDKEQNKCPMLASRAMSSRLNELWRYVEKRAETPHEDWLNERSLWPELPKYKTSFMS